jgi:hypothetical protein
MGSIQGTYLHCMPHIALRNMIHNMLMICHICCRYVRKQASKPDPVYLLDFAMAHPPDTWRLPNNRFKGTNSLNTVSDVTNC